MRTYIVNMEGSFSVTREIKARKVEEAYLKATEEVKKDLDWDFEFESVEISTVGDFDE